MLAWQWSGEPEVQSPSGVVLGVGMLTTDGKRYGGSQFRGSVSSNLAFRLDRLGQEDKQENVLELTSGVNIWSFIFCFTINDL